MPLEIPFKLQSQLTGNITNKINEISQMASSKIVEITSSDSSEEDRSEKRRNNKQSPAVAKAVEKSEEEVRGLANSAPIQGAVPKITELTKEQLKLEVVQLQDKHNFKRSPVYKMNRDELVGLYKYLTAIDSGLMQAPVAPIQAPVPVNNALVAPTLVPKPAATPKSVTKAIKDLTTNPEIANDAFALEILKVIKDLIKIVNNITARRESQ